MSEKACSKCLSIKPLSDFFNDKRLKSGKGSRCKACQTQATNNSIINKWGNTKHYYSEYRNRILGGNPRIIFAKKKNNAITHGIPFNINIDEFVEWYQSQEKICAYCDIPQEKISEYQYLMPNMNIHRLTIDRIVNTEYTIGNICLCCARCNLIKSNILSYDEMRKIGQEYVKPKWKS